MTNKTGFHPRNRHAQNYDFAALTSSSPELAQYVTINQYGNQSIDFSNPKAVIALNAALLKFFYHIEHWSLPPHHLCPPIPGRADYIHYMADVIQNETGPVNVLDIGVGANCIYPLIGQHEYQWNVVGSEINPMALKNAQKIIDENHLASKIKLKLQTDSQKIFKNIVEDHERFTFSMCNPPFHSSQAEAQAGTARKNRNLNIPKDRLNFGGKSNELWCEGGELAFISNMIKESTEYKNQIRYFSSLVSKAENIKPLTHLLQKLNIPKYQIIEMQQGQKKSRILVWTF
jgi:23S rRNA (adenine1618-N6)-methyltransferase